MSPTPIPLPSYSPTSVRGFSSVCFRERLADEGCHRTGILGTQFLQPFVCYTEGHGWLASSHRSFSPQQLCPPFSFLHGNLPVSPPFPALRGLDDFHRPSGRLPPGSSPPGISEVPQVLSWPSALPISGSLLWSFIRSASFHPCHGPDLLHYASFWLSDLALSRRLARPWILSSGDCVGERPFVMALQATRGSVNLSKSSLTPTQTLDYLGMTLQSTPLRAFPTRARIQKVLSLVDEFSSSREQPLSLWQSLLGVMSSMSTLIPGSRLRMRPLQLRLNVAGPQTSEDALISWDDFLPPGSSVVVRRQPSRQGSLPRSPSAASSLYRRVGLRLGGFAGRRLSVWLVVSGCFDIFDQPPQTPGDSVGCPGFSPSPPGSVCLAVHRQHYRSVLSALGGGHAIFRPQCGSSS